MKQNRIYIENLFDSAYRDNPQTPMYIRPEVPFDGSIDPNINYDRGCVYASKKNNRRYVALDNSRNTKSKKNISYARYIYQIRYWRLFGKWLPQDLQVDHINDNPLDDTLFNYQLLTGHRNLMKAVSLLGLLSYVVVCPSCACKFIVEPYRVLVDYVIFCSRQCAIIFNMCKIDSETTAWLKKHQLVYEIKQWQYKEQPYIEIFNALSREMIHYNQDDVRRFFNADINAPRFLPTKEKAKLIKHYHLTEGLTGVEIARRLGVTETTISEIRKNHTSLPMQKDRTRTFVDTIKTYLDAGRNQAEISEILSVPEGRLSKAIAKYLPEYTQQALIQKKMIKIQELKNTNMDHNDISITMGMTSRDLSYFLSNYKRSHPEFVL